MISPPIDRDFSVIDLVAGGDALQVTVEIAPGIGWFRTPSINSG